MYTDDVVHDTIGLPGGPVHGRDAAQGLYEFLTANVHTDRMGVNRASYGEDFCVIEHQLYGTVPGEFLGVPGHGRAINFRMLHIWEFTNERMSRETVWLDGGAIMAQLTAPDNATTAT